MKKTALALWLLACLGAVPAFAQGVPANGTVQACTYYATPPTYTDPGGGVYENQTCDATGNLRTTGTGGSGGAATIADGADTTQGAKADTAYAGSGAATVVSILKGLYGGITGPIPFGSNAIGSTYSFPYPFGAVPITASATGTTAATTATLVNVTGHTTYICGYSIRANATAAATVTDTMTGVITATMSSILWVSPLASGLGVDEQIFSPCIPASAISTSIAVVSGAPGAGGTVSVKAWGYSL